MKAVLFVALFALAFATEFDNLCGATVHQWEGRRQTGYCLSDAFPVCNGLLVKGECPKQAGCCVGGLSVKRKELNALIAPEEKCPGSCVEATEDSPAAQNCPEGLVATAHFSCTFAKGAEKNLAPARTCCVTPEKAADALAKDEEDFEKKNTGKKTEKCGAVPWQWAGDYMEGSCLSDNFPVCTGRIVPGKCKNGRPCCVGGFAIAQFNHQKDINTCEVSSVGGQCVADTLHWPATQGCPKGFVQSSSYMCPLKRIDAIRQIRQACCIPKKQAPKCGAEKVVWAGKTETPICTSGKLNSCVGMEVPDQRCSKGEVCCAGGISMAPVVMEKYVAKEENCVNNGGLCAMPWEGGAAKCDKGYNVSDKHICPRAGVCCMKA